MIANAQPAASGTIPQVDEKMGNGRSAVPTAKGSVAKHFAATPARQSEQPMALGLRQGPTADDSDDEVTYIGKRRNRPSTTSTASAPRSHSARKQASDMVFYKVEPQNCKEVEEPVEENVMRVFPYIHYAIFFANLLSQPSRQGA